MNQNISIERIKNLYLYDWIVNKQKWILGAASIFGIMLVSALYQAIWFHNQIEQGFHYGFLSFFFFIGSVALGSRAFIHLKNAEGVIHHMSIPASKFEKYLVSLSQFTLYFLAVIIIHYVFGLFGKGLWAIADLGYFTTVYFPIGWLLKKYLTFSLIHAVYFLGAAVFRKNAFFKTLAVLIGLSILLSILGGIGAFYYTHYWAQQGEMRSFMIEIGDEYAEMIQYGMKALGVVVLFTLWRIAFVRFKKIQA